VFTGPREAYYAATKNFSTDPKAPKATFHVYRLTDMKKSEPVLNLDVAGKIWNVSVLRGETTLPRVILIPDSKK
jgi:hypothetical protein